MTSVLMVTAVTQLNEKYLNLKNVALSTFFVIQYLHEFGLGFSVNKYLNWFENIFFMIAFIMLSGV